MSAFTRSIDIVDVESSDSVEQVDLRCPYTSVRLVDPVVPQVCANKHPRKCMSRASVEEFARKRRSTARLLCPYCFRTNIYGSNLLSQNEISTVLSETDPDTNRAYYRDGRYFRDDACKIEIKTDRPFAPDATQPARAIPAPKKDATRTMMSFLRQPAPTRPIAEIVSKRKDGTFETDDPVQLKKIRVEEKIIRERLGKNGRASRSKKKDATDEALEEFWKIAYADFSKRFGTPTE
jgi:hypothetical protein